MSDSVGSTPEIQNTSLVMKSEFLSYFIWFLLGCLAHFGIQLFIISTKQFAVVLELAEDNSGAFQANMVALEILSCFTGFFGAYLLCPFNLVCLEITILTALVSFMFLSMLIVIHKTVAFYTYIVTTIITCCCFGIIEMVGMSAANDPGLPGEPTHRIIAFLAGHPIGYLVVLMVTLLVECGTFGNLIETSGSVAALYSLMGILGVICFGLPFVFYGIGYLYHANSKAFGRITGTISNSLIYFYESWRILRYCGHYLAILLIIQAGEAFLNSTLLLFLGNPYPQFESISCSLIIVIMYTVFDFLGRIFSSGVRKMILFTKERNKKMHEISKERLLQNDNTNGIAEHSSTGNINANGGKATNGNQGQASNGQGSKGASGTGTGNGNDKGDDNEPTSEQKPKPRLWDDGGEMKRIPAVSVYDSRKQGMNVAIHIVHDQDARTASEGLGEMPIDIGNEVVGVNRNKNKEGDVRRVALNGVGDKGNEHKDNKETNGNGTTISNSSGSGSSGVENIRKESPHGKPKVFGVYRPMGTGTELSGNMPYVGSEYDTGVVIKKEKMLIPEVGGSSTSVSSRSSSGSNTSTAGNTNTSISRSKSKEQEKEKERRIRNGDEGSNREDNKDKEDEGKEYLKYTEKGDPRGIPPVKTNSTTTGSSSSNNTNGTTKPSGSNGNGSGSGSGVPEDNGKEIKEDEITKTNKEQLEKDGETKEVKQNERENIEKGNKEEKKEDSKGGKPDEGSKDTLVDMDFEDSPEYRTKYRIGKYRAVLLGMWVLVVFRYFTGLCVFFQRHYPESYSLSTIVNLEGILIVTLINVSIRGFILTYVYSNIYETSKLHYLNDIRVTMLAVAGEPNYCVNARYDASVISSLVVSAVVVLEVIVFIFWSYIGYKYNRLLYEAELIRETLDTWPTDNLKTNCGKLVWWLKSIGVLIWRDVIHPFDLF